MCIIRNAQPSEFVELGQLMVEAYALLDGFPKPHEQPRYYSMLANIGEFASKPGSELLVAISANGQLMGGVVYFSDMQYYGSGGIAIQEKNSAGFRLLAVSTMGRGKGIGRQLASACINKAKTQGVEQIIIHSTQSMQTAWKMYERMGFARSLDLDFMQGELAVYGFRMRF
jgi:GNAT superfamily N-acetyltransferase